MLPSITATATSVPLVYKRPRSGSRNPASPIKSRPNGTPRLDHRPESPRLHSHASMKSMVTDAPIIMPDSHREVFLGEVESVCIVLARVPAIRV